MKNIVVFAVIIVCLAATIASKKLKVQNKSKEKELTKEEFCAGCEVTMKELDRLLRHKPTTSTEHAVNKAVRNVCKKENFKNYDKKADIVVKACQKLVANPAVESVLINRYGMKHDKGQKSSHLDMINLICNEVTEACHAKLLKTHKTEGGIEFDHATQEFKITAGSKVKTPNPTSEHEHVHTEL